MPVRLNLFLHFFFAFEICRQVLWELGTSKGQLPLSSLVICDVGSGYAFNHAQLPPKVRRHQVLSPVSPDLISQTIKMEVAFSNKSTCHLSIYTLQPSEPAPGHPIHYLSLNFKASRAGYITPFYRHGSSVEWGRTGEASTDPWWSRAFGSFASCSVPCASPAALGFVSRILKHFGSLFKIICRDWHEGEPYCPFRGLENLIAQRNSGEEPSLVWGVREMKDSLLSRLSQWGCFSY